MFQLGTVSVFCEGAGRPIAPGRSGCASLGTASAAVSPAAATSTGRGDEYHVSRPADATGWFATTNALANPTRTAAALASIPAESARGEPPPGYRRQSHDGAPG